MRCKANKHLARVPPYTALHHCKGFTDPSKPLRKPLHASAGGSDAAMRSSGGIPFPEARTRPSIRSDKYTPLSGSTPAICIWRSIHACHKRTFTGTQMTFPPPLQPSTSSGMLRPSAEENWSSMTGHMTTPFSSRASLISSALVIKASTSAALPAATTGRTKPLKRPRGTRRLLSAPVEISTGNSASRSSLLATAPMSSPFPHTSRERGRPSKRVSTHSRDGSLGHGRTTAIFAGHTQRVHMRKCMRTRAQCSTAYLSMRSTAASRAFASRRYSATQTTKATTSIPTF